jgi:hypothetical protein
MTRFFILYTPCLLLYTVFYLFWCKEVESGLKQSIRGVVEETNKLVNNMENVAANEANLEAKIEKKRVELERNQEPNIQQPFAVHFFGPYFGTLKKHVLNR